MTKVQKILNLIPAPRDGQDGKPGRDGISPNTAFKSIVFTRKNLSPSFPVGGSYSHPVPDGDEWHDAVPDGSQKLWMSSRLFSSDGKAPQEKAWSAPKVLSSSSDFEIVYSEQELPQAPTGHPCNTPGWVAHATSKTIWMATQIIENGTPLGWEVAKIKGERGQDGTSIKIKGTLDSTAQLPAQPEDASDCYIIGEDIWVWDGEKWKNAGQFKGPKGDTGLAGKNAFMYVRYSKSNKYGDWSDQGGLVPDKYIGICTTQSSTAPTEWNDYAPWTKWKGDDGFGYEYIYKLTESKIVPDVPTDISQQDNFVPSGWTDDPNGVSPSSPFEWVCYRKKTDGKWGKFIGTNGNNKKAALWASYAFGTGMNLLEQTEFKSIEKMDKWTKTSNIVNSGYNGHNCYEAYYLNSSYTNILSQEIQNKLKPSKWYVLSFFVTKGEVNNTSLLNRVQSFIYPTVIDTNKGCFIDDVFTTNVASDGSVTWDVTSQWERHTFAFYTKNSFSGIKYTMFRLMQNYNGVKICMPKLEEGCTATDYIPNTTELNGVDGISYIGTDEYYQWHDRGDVPPSGKWTKNVIPAHPEGIPFRYLWNYEVINKSDGSYDTTAKHVISSEGKGVTSILEEYAVTATSQAPTSGWQQTKVLPTKDFPYLWNRETLFFNDGTSTANVRLIAQRGEDGKPGEDGRPGEDGKPGEDGQSSISVLVTADNITFRRMPQAQQVYIGVDVFDGLNQVEYDGLGGNSGYACSTLHDVGNSLHWTFRTNFDYHKFCYILTLRENETVDVEYSFTVTYKGIKFYKKLRVSVISDGTDGSKGPTMRGPQDYEQCPMGYKFLSGAEGERYIDVVLYRNKYFYCSKSHTKDSSNFPGNTNGEVNNVWRYEQETQLIATNLFLANYARIKNLGASAIEMYNADNTQIVFSAKDGNVKCLTGSFKNVDVEGSLSAAKIDLNFPKNSQSADDSALIFGGNVSLPELPEGTCRMVYCVYPMVTRMPPTLSFYGENGAVEICPYPDRIEGLQQLTIDEYGIWQLIGIHTTNFNMTRWFINKLANTQ